MATGGTFDPNAFDEAFDTEGAPSSGESHDNVFVAAGFVVDGFYAPLSVVPPTPMQPPAIIHLGTRAAVVHALPFRALGGSVADLDLLHGVLGKQAWREDIQPIFAVALRDGEIRVCGFEVPRPAILAVAFHGSASLLRVANVRIEGNPAGDNLFGYVGLTTRPISQVVVDNTNGEWSRLVDLELVQHAPSGLYVDIAHTVVMPVLTGTIVDYEEDEDGGMILSYGQAARRAAPLD
jgi:hypothetical protein